MERVVGGSLPEALLLPSPEALLPAYLLAEQQHMEADPPYADVFKKTGRSACL